MSCFRPISILNPSKRFDTNGGHRFELTVPCGSCSECKKSQYNEWYFRAYYQARSTFDNGGYLLFDTLTYKPACLPHLSKYIDDIPRAFNYPCFSRRDIQLFFKRLRINLTRKGYDVSDGLKYFLSSEYGTDENHLHLPHYHIIFYVTANIPPIVLSRAISSSWSFGRTDGARYKGIGYVMQRRVFDSKSDTLSIQFVSRYVTKYVMKDSEFDKQINFRLTNLLKSKGYDEKSFEGKKYIRDLRRYVAQFHIQSQGFGAQFVNYNSHVDLIERNVIRLPDSVSTVKFIPLPTYMKRKLFYQIVKDFRGLPKWVLTDFGQIWKCRRTFESIDLLSSHFSNWYSNLGNFVGDFDTQARNFTMLLLDGRSFYDFAKYISLYKGVIKSDGYIPSFDFWIPLISVDSFRNGVAKPLFSYTNMYDRHHYGFPFLSDAYLGDSTNGYIDDDFLVDIIDKIDVWKKENLYNEDSFYEWRDFDKLWKFYCMSLVVHNTKKDSLFEYVERVKKVWKAYR